VGANRLVPELHTTSAEIIKWSFYKDATSSSKARGSEKQLFPGQATLKREENHRWEITEVHWDLPIRQVDPNAPEE
jgi:hypothetical protein